VQRRRVGCQWGHAEQSGVSDIPLECPRGGEHEEYEGRQRDAQVETQLGLKSR
jgi:hypothetical protein